MYFLNYKEVDLFYINKSTLRYILFKQNLNLNNIYDINLPIIRYYFIFKKIVDINLLKIYNNVILIWLLTGKSLLLKNFFTKFERGVRYYRFFLTSKKIKNNEFLFIIFNFLSDVILFLTDKRFLKVSFNNNIYFLKLLNLEFFSNIRLGNSFYTAKLNDILYIYIHMKNNEKILINKYLNQFKIYLN